MTIPKPSNRSSATLDDTLDDALDIFVIDPYTTHT